MCDPCMPLCPPICDPCCPMPCDPCCAPCYPPSCDPCYLPCCPPSCGPCCPPPCPPKRCKSRELKGSVLITQCECVRRNGLQLDCPRSECKGRPMCNIKPWPSCCPSKYSWRYTNVTMGKPTNPCRPKPPCRPPCEPCCEPCCDPCCDPCC